MSVDIKTAKLGQQFSQKDLKLKFQAIYGGVAWPGKRPGYAVVAAMGWAKHFDNYDIYLLDEFESMDMRVLVRQCGVLDYKYLPTMCLGDGFNDAADRFIQEMNSEREPDYSGQQITIGKQLQRHFSICKTPILDMVCPYSYIMPELKRLLDKERRQLFLKDSKIFDYLVGIETQEIPTMEFGVFPAIEALAFAVIGLRKYGAVIDLDLPTESDIAGSYSPKTNA